MKLQIPQLISKKCSDFFVLRIQSFKSNEAIDIFFERKVKPQTSRFRVKMDSEIFYIGFFLFWQMQL